MANFSTPFTTPANYTYDASKIEVVGGLATLKDLVPTNAVLYSPFDDKDANWAIDSVTGTLNGSPTFSAGKMVCTGSQGVRYTISNLLPSGTMRVKYTPNYSDNPPANINIFSIEGIASGNNRLLLTHSPSGDTWRITLTDGNNNHILVAGTIGSSGVGLVASTEYEVELNWDSSSGIIRLFIDGNLYGTLSPGSWSFISTSAYFKVGASSNVYNRAEGFFDNAILYSMVQHTSNYIPGETIPLTRYSTDVPSIYFTDGHNPGVGIGEWLDFSEVLGVGNEGTVKYQLSLDAITWQYWNGSAWVTAGANDYNSASEVASNIPEFETDVESVYSKAFLISNGDQQIELDSFSIAHIHNSSPSTFPGLDKTAIYNVAINPFSDAIIIDLEDNIAKAEYKDIDAVDWIDIPKGSFSTFEEAVQNLSVAFTHSGEKKYQLRITDIYDLEMTDKLTINVNRKNVTVNIKDDGGVHLPNVMFNPGDSLHTNAVYNSPFTIDYGIGTNTYTAIKDYFDTISESETIDITSSTVNITMPKSTRLSEATINVDFPERKIYKGDYFDFSGYVNLDLTDYKIRCEIYDEFFNEIKLSTANSGGSNNEIEIINAPNGEFIVIIAEDLTDNFDNRTYIELELEDSNGQVSTIWKKELYLSNEEIEWTEPS